MLAALRAMVLYNASLSARHRAECHVELVVHVWRLEFEVGVVVAQVDCGQELALGAAVAERAFALCVRGGELVAEAAVETVVL